YVSVIVRLFIDEMLSMFLFFFFQAEDGIRDRTVTGVQTCALPIYGPLEGIEDVFGNGAGVQEPLDEEAVEEREDERRQMRRRKRSEERRVGKECRSRGGAAL